MGLYNSVLMGSPIKDDSDRIGPSSDILLKKKNHSTPLVHTVLLPTYLTHYSVCLIYRDWLVALTAGFISQCGEDF